MLPLLRILFGLAFIYEMVEGARSAPSANETGDLTGAAYMVVCVGLAMLNALVWAPYLGTKVSDPLTGVMTGSTYVEQTNWVLRLLRWCDARKHRRATLALSFWEAVRHPNSPAPFITGLRNTRHGTWLEKIFAREVFRFSNIQNCVHAYLALKRHGVHPRPHPSQEVNIMLLSLERPPRPEATTMALPVAPKATPLPRNRRIRLFKRAEAVAAATSISAERDPETASETAPGLEREPDIGTDPVHSPTVGRWITNMFARVAEFIRAH